MEFNEKLQQLRKQKNLTQEELAQILYVSRAAVSKWESGRGYPSLDSLKAISKTFSVTIDDLLSGDELITLAEEDKKENVVGLRGMLYGLLDIMCLVFIFVPLFGQKGPDMIHSVSLLALSSSYVKVTYIVIISAIFIYGIFEVALHSFQNNRWIKFAPIFSLSLSILATIIFIISQQPYLAFFMLWILILKGYLYIKQQ